MNSSAESSSSKWFRLLSRKPRWGFTWQGWLLLLLLAMGISVAAFLGIHPFLAANCPVHAQVLVVEGWMSTGEMHDAAEIIRSGNYQMVYTTGGPFDDAGENGDASKTYAADAAERLRSLGIDGGAVQAAPCFVWRHDRTYSSAVALREWLKSHGKTVTAMNIATEGTHARRTLRMFQMAFGNDVSVGVIPIKNLFYEPEHWWRYSEGIKAVVSEGAGYLYTQFLFRKDD